MIIIKTPQLNTHCLGRIKMANNLADLWLECIIDRMSPEFVLLLVCPEVSCEHDSWKQQTEMRLIVISPLYTALQRSTTNIAVAKIAAAIGSAATAAMQTYFLSSCCVYKRAHRIYLLVECFCCRLERLSSSLCFGAISSKLLDLMPVCRRS